MPSLWLCCILVAFTGPTFAFSQCKYDGKLFQPFTQVYKFYDEKRDWCSVGICRFDGTIWKLIDLSCRRKTTQPPTEPGTTTPGVETTSSEPTTPLVTKIATQDGCFYEGKAYAPGSEIFRGVEKNKNVCYTLVCSVGGDVVVQNKRRCRSTTVPPATKSRLPKSSKHTLEKIEIMTREGKVDTTANSHVTTDQLKSTEQPRTEKPEVADSLQTSEQARTGQPVRTDVIEQSRAGKPVKTDRLPGTEQLKTGKPETTDRLPTTEQPGTGQPETAAQFETTEQPRTGQLETTDQIKTTEQPRTGQLETDQIETTEQPRTGQLETDQIETTEQPFTTPPYTTVPLPETTPPHFTPFGCYYNRKYYRPGSTIYEGYDESSDWCYGVECSSGGSVIHWDTWNCKGQHKTTAEPTTVPPTPYHTTDYPTMAQTTKFVTLENNLRTEPRNEGINTEDPKEVPTTKLITPENNRETEPRTGGPSTMEPTEASTRRYVTSENNLVTEPRVEGPTISMTTEEVAVLTTPEDTLKTEEPYTAKPVTTEQRQELATEPPVKLGCYENGKFYVPGSIISSGYEKESDRCYGLQCSYEGETVSFDTPNCKRGEVKTKTLEETSVQLATTVPSTEQWSVSTELDKTTVPFRVEGSVGTDSIPGAPASETTVPRTTALPLTTISTRVPTQPGCYDNGKFYPPGSDISKGYDESTDWCYGSLCDENGQIISWDTWNCKKKSKTPPTTTAPPIPTTSPDPTPPYPPTPPGCYDNGKFYPPGSDISEGYDESSDWCYGSICDQNGEIISWDTWNCKKKSTTPPATTAPPIPTTSPDTTPPYPPTPPGCYDNGKFYPPGSDISKGYDESTDWCYGSICDENGQIISWDTWNCKKKSTNPPTTTAPPIPTTSPDTTPPYPTTPPGCYDNGKFYPPGSDISEGYDESSDWCYGSICDENGQIISWDTWNCKKKSTTPPATTAPPIPTTSPDTTPPYPTTPPGCYDNGKFYPPGSDISKGYDESTDWCYGSICDENGQIISWDTWNCKKKSTTPPATTAPPIPTTSPDTTPPYPSTPPGCYDNGKFYPPGSDISKGYHESRDLCYGSFCDKNGKIVMWDTWNCKRKTATPPATTAPPIPTTLPNTTPPYPLTLPGCYDNGKFYPPGSDITVGYDESTDWCYGSICDENGQIVSWDTWNCKKKSTTPATTTAPPIPTTLPGTTPSSTNYGCFYDGRQYEPEEQISEGYDEGSNWCYGLYCGNDGQVSTWDKFDCKSTTVRPTTTPLQTTTPPLLTLQRCYYKGRYYVPGKPIIEEFDPAYGLCYDAYCGENGYIVKLDEPICKGPSLLNMTKSDKPLKTNPVGPSVPVTTVENGVTMPLLTATTTEPDVVDSQKTTVTITEVTFNKKCFYDGRYILPGEDVYRKYDAQENWCYGLVCDESSSLVYWEKLHCKAATTTPRPLLSLSLESILEKIAASGSTKHGSVKQGKEEKPQKPKRCLYKGLEYMANQFIKKVCGEYGKCSVLFCNHNGIVVPKLLSDITRKEDTRERGFIFQSTKEKLSKGF